MEVEAESKQVKKIEDPPDVIFDSIAYALGNLAPHPDDVGSITVEIKMPLPLGFFIGGRFKLEAERGDSDFRARLEASLTGGIDWKIFNATLSVGGYIEAKGRTPRDCMDLASYGIYRLICEQGWIFEKVANLLWSDEDKLVSSSPFEKVVQRENVLLALYQAPADTRYPHVNLHRQRSLVSWEDAVRAVVFAHTT